MSITRKQLLQELVKKLTQASNSIGVGSCFKFGDQALTRPQTELLFFIATHTEGVSVKELAHEFHVTSGAITQVVDSMVTKKILSRSEDKDDRRVLKIELTKEARKTLPAFEKEYITEIGQRFEQLNDSEIAELINLLSKVEGKYCDQVKGGECNE